MQYIETELVPAVAEVVRLRNEMWDAMRRVEKLTRVEVVLSDFNIFDDAANTEDPEAFDAFTDGIADNDSAF